MYARVLSFLITAFALISCELTPPQTSTTAPSDSSAASPNGFMSAPLSSSNNKSTTKPNGSAASPNRGRLEGALKASGGVGGGNRFLELPSTSEGERIISHTGYTLSYNTTTLCPNWVAWELTSSETRGHLERSRDFYPDESVPERQRVTTSDYTGSGYTRGHMCPAADMEWGAKALHDCFLMSNMCPQTEELNRYSWEALERACRRWARKEGKVLIVCGPIFNPERRVKTIGRKHKVRVPDAFFKCVISTRKGNEKGIAFIYQNNRANQDMKDCATTVDAVERLTGYNFFVNISDSLEERLERQCNLSAWH